MKAMMESLLGGCLCVDSKLSTLVKNRPISLVEKPTLSTELEVDVVEVTDKIYRFHSVSVFMLA